MAYVQLYTHMVFRTYNSQPYLTEEPRNALERYVRGITEKLGIYLHAIGGVPDHIHLLLGLPPTLSVAEAAQKLKANTSRLLNRNGDMSERFRWREGYGAFSVSPGHLQQIKRYIDRQVEHHRKVTSDDELERILALYGLEDTLIRKRGEYAD